MRFVGYGLALCFIAVVMMVGPCKLVGQELEFDIPIGTKAVDVGFRNNKLNVSTVGKTNHLLLRWKAFTNGTYLVRFHVPDHELVGIDFGLVSHQAIEWQGEIQVEEARIVFPVYGFDYVFQVVAITDGKWFESQQRYVRQRWQK